MHDLVDARSAQQFTCRQSVAATQYEHRACTGTERGIDEALGVAVLVAGGELQTAVQIQPHVVAAAGDHDLLIRGLPAGDDRVGVKPLAAGRFDVLGAHQQGGKQRQRQAQRAERRDQLPRAHYPPQQENRHDSRGEQVDDAGRRGATDHAQMGQQHEWPRQPTDQRAEVVGGVEVGQRPPGVGGASGAAPLQQGHQQRHLGADQRTDQRGAQRQHQQRPADEGEHHVQHGGRQSADDGQQCFNRDESDCSPMQ